MAWARRDAGMDANMGVKKRQKWVQITPKTREKVEGKQVTACEKRRQGAHEGKGKPLGLEPRGASDGV